MSGLREVCRLGAERIENLLFLKPQNSPDQGPGVCIGGVVGCGGEGGRSEKSDGVSIKQSCPLLFH